MNRKLACLILLFALFALPMGSATSQEGHPFGGTCRSTVWFDCEPPEYNPAPGSCIVYVEVDRDNNACAGAGSAAS